MIEGECLFIMKGVAILTRS